MGKLVKQKSIKILEVLMDQVDIELFHIPFDLKCFIDDTGLIMQRPDRCGRLRIYPKDADRIVVETTVGINFRVLGFDVKTIAERAEVSRWVVSHFMDND
ncbi:hypothetical protein ST201phi2-1p047 [Pseudomonas phage 201phi2-1]|uniref:Uncharacterized protein n=1 Tax=Pseudomonas phage 201phi2-1 TaxID=198110 RepID=B3FK22_BP201|nr:hypothetical protein ST201phi2-1p047 [Pseudomonas phage 201phi2-1]ABY62880.1 hypothetical protein 201phi2-1p047 [Pseudomonas phage 201phi2-1]